MQQFKNSRDHKAFFPYNTWHPAEPTVPRTQGDKGWEAISPKAIPTSKCELASQVMIPPEPAEGACGCEELERCHVLMTNQGRH